MEAVNQKKGSPGGGVSAGLKQALAASGSVVWPVFLVWTAVGFVIMPLNPTEEMVREWITWPAAEGIAVSILWAADAVWMILAAITVYLCLVATEGIGRARLIAGVVLVGSGAIEIVGELTDFPFGPYDYSDRFGWKLFGILPIAIPMAWLVVVAGGRHLMLWLYPQAPRLLHAAGVAIVALGTDLLLEPVAWKFRGYWTWYPGTIDAYLAAWPPLQNYLSWYGFAFLLAAILPLPRTKHLQDGSASGVKLGSGIKENVANARIIVTLALTNAIFLVCHIAMWLR